MWGLAAGKEAQVSLRASIMSSMKSCDTERMGHICVAHVRQNTQVIVMQLKNIFF